MTTPTSIKSVQPRQWLVAIALISGTFGKAFGVNGGAARGKQQVGSQSHIYFSVPLFHLEPSVSECEKGITQFGAQGFIGLFLGVKHAGELLHFGFSFQQAALQSEQAVLLEL